MLSTKDVVLGDPALARSGTRTTTQLRPDEVFDGKAPDGIFFRRLSKPEDVRWDLKFVRFTEKVKLDHNEELDMDKWLVLLFEPMEEGGINTVYYQTIIGDPLRFVKNHVAVNVQGFVIKKSIAGFTVLEKALDGLPLDEIRSRIAADLKAFSIA